MQIQFTNIQYQGTNRSAYSKILLIEYRNNIFVLNKFPLNSKKFNIPSDIVRSNVPDKGISHALL